jgi:hypothetical protein
MTSWGMAPVTQLTLFRQAIQPVPAAMAEQGHACYISKA